MQMTNAQSLEILKALRHLRYACIVEGTTLLILLGIAVPLKHFAGEPMVVSIMGPVHGLAFLFYIWLAINIASGARWKKREVVCVLGAALVPFSGFFVLKFIQHQRNLPQRLPLQPASMT
jgi:integral membrane protein